MKYRKFGRLGWLVSEIGYGMWGMGEWKGSNDTESLKSLSLAIEKGVNFFDTAYAYGNGHSESILNSLIKEHKGKKLYTASKIPPMNLQWSSKSHYILEDVYPAKHIIEFTEKSLKNIGVEKIDLMQFHVWEDSWAKNDEWKEAIEKLKQDGKVEGFGISINRWEPENSLETIKTGHIDAVQVIYNIFDQAPEDKLFPLCEEKDIAVIARVPFDEGTLTGNITKDTVFPEGDWRASYFVPENLNASAEKADLLRPIVPSNMTMAEMALRFILSNPTISTTIPGMRKEKNVLANTTTSDGNNLSEEMIQTLRGHRWDRVPTSWSQ